MKVEYTYIWLPNTCGEEVKTWVAETEEECKRVENIIRENPDKYTLMAVIRK